MVLSGGTTWATITDGTLRGAGGLVHFRLMRADENKPAADFCKPLDHAVIVGQRTAIG